MRLIAQSRFIHDVLSFMFRSFDRLTINTNGLSCIYQPGNIASNPFNRRTKLAGSSSWPPSASGG
jgi:hypothetical protein